MLSFWIFISCLTLVACGHGENTVIKGKKTILFLLCGGLEIKGQIDLRYQTLNENVLYTPAFD